MGKLVKLSVISFAVLSSGLVMGAGKSRGFELTQFAGLSLCRERVPLAEITPKLPAALKIAQDHRSTDYISSPSSSDESDYSPQTLLGARVYLADLRARNAQARQVLEEFLALALNDSIWHSPKTHTSPVAQPAPTLSPLPPAPPPSPVSPE